MFDLGWGELLVIGIVALVVIGPKDLPQMFRTLGRMTAKARGMAREFQRAMETAADEAGMKDVQRDFRDMTSAKNFGLDAMSDLTEAGLSKPVPSPAPTPNPTTSAIPDPDAPAAPVAAKPAPKKPKAAEATAKPAPKPRKKKPAAEKAAPGAGETKA